MNMLARWKQPQTDVNAYLGDPLDLDPDFEEACARSLQEPMQTPVERLREVQENILTVLRDKDEAHDQRIAELRIDLAAEEKAKAANLEEIASVERSIDALASPSPKPDKPKSCRRTSISETAGRAGEAKAG